MSDDEREVVRGASDEELDRTAAVFLASVAWEGPSLDPDTLDAATFLAQL